MEPDRLAAEKLREKLAVPSLVVRTVTSGQEALERIEKEHYDIIVSAMEMASPNGMELLSNLRERGFQTPVVLMSRNVGDQDKADTMVVRWGNSVVMPRPVRLNWLYSTIETILKVQIDWRESREAPRIPLRLDVAICFEDSSGTLLEMRGVTVDIGPGGLRFERRMCGICTGYEQGTIHRDCVLWPYSWAHRRGKPVEVTLSRGGKDGVTLEGRFIHTFIEDGTALEVIGLKYVDPTDEQRRGLANLLEDKPFAEN